MEQVAKEAPANPGKALWSLEKTLSKAAAGDKEAQLRDLRTWLFEGLTGLNRSLAALTGEAETLPNHKAGQYILDSAGKRLRPMCTFVAAQLGPNPDAAMVLDVALAAELVHSATLLHDDVIDIGMERRGKPPARIVYGNAAAVLAGDFLLVRAIQFVHRHRRPDTLDRLMTVIEDMVNAEAEQLDRRGEPLFDEEAYMSIVRGKTASLFQWCLSQGAAAAGAGEDTVSALDTYGYHLGVAFQMVDDVLDVAGDPEETGKELFIDLREGKMTYPFLVAAKRDTGFADAVMTWLDGPEDASPAPIVDRLQKTGAVEETRRVAAQHATLAMDAISALSEEPAFEVLETITQAALQRKR